MTIHTPFARRPATPWVVNSFPTPLGDYQQPDTTVEVLNAITAGSIAAGNVLNPGQYGYGQCPYGTVFNPQTYSCQPGLSGTLSASGNSGIVIVLIIGAALFLLGGRK